MSVQDAADASQSVTLPCFSLVAPELTEATNVTTVPDVTLAPDARELLSAAMARFVAVGTDPRAATAPKGSPKITDKKTDTSPAFPDAKASPRF